MLYPQGNGLAGRGLAAQLPLNELDSYIRVYKMHEMSLALNIVELAEAESRNAGGGRIRQLEVEVGELAGVMAEALEFCFQAASKDTLADGAELVLVTVAGAGECASCRQTVPMAEQFSLCPSCGGLLRPVRGRELRLVAITID